MKTRLLHQRSQQEGKGGGDTSSCRGKPVRIEGGYRNQEGRPKEGTGVSTGGAKNLQRGIAERVGVLGD